MIGDGPLPPREIISIAQQITSALQHAHASDVLHRDIKPSNIFYETDANHENRAILMDFGLARSLQTPPTSHSPHHRRHPGIPRSRTNRRRPHPHSRHRPLLPWRHPLHPRLRQAPLLRAIPHQPPPKKSPSTNPPPSTTSPLAQPTHPHPPLQKPSRSPLPPPRELLTLLERQELRKNRTNSSSQSRPSSSPSSPSSPSNTSPTHLSPLFFLLPAAISSTDSKSPSQPPASTPSTPSPSTEISPSPPPNPIPFSPSQNPPSPISTTKNLTLKNLTIRLDQSLEEPATSLINTSGSALQFINCRIESPAATPFPSTIPPIVSASSALDLQSPIPPFSPSAPPSSTPPPEAKLTPPTLSSWPPPSSSPTTQTTTSSNSTKPPPSILNLILAKPGQKPNRILAKTPTSKSITPSSGHPTPPALPSPKPSPGKDTKTPSPPPAAGSPTIPSNGASAATPTPTRHLRRLDHPMALQHLQQGSRPVLIPQDFASEYTHPSLFKFSSFILP